MGTYSRHDFRLEVGFDNESGDSGSKFNLYFNNIIVGGYSDNADNYVTPGWTTGGNLGQGPISGATSSSYAHHSEALTSANNGDQYQVVVYKQLWRRPFQCSNAHGCQSDDYDDLTVDCRHAECRL